NSLECHKCLINEGNCSQAPVEVCRANQDACFTVIKKYDGFNRDGLQNGLECQVMGTPKPELWPDGPFAAMLRECRSVREELEPIIKGCGNNSSFEDLQVLYQIGRDFAFFDQKICDQSSCNNRSFPECALQKQQVLRCTGAMNRCVRIIRAENKSTAVTIQKGCATESMCRRDTDIYFRLKRENTHAECCKRNLCNQAHSPTSPQLVTILTLWLVLKVYP
ncbi:hypothetical protein E2320_000685, partial [Naja naja]